MRLIVLAVVAAIAVAGCAKKSDAPSSAASVAAADIDAASPLDKPYRLKGGEKLDVDRLFDLLPLYLRPTYEKAAFDQKTGATIVTNLKFGEVAAGKGFTAKRAEFYGVDLQKIEKLEAAKDAPSDAPLSMVLEKVRLFGIENVRADETAPNISIGAVEIDSLRVRDGGIPKRSPASGLASFFNAFDIAGVYFKDVRFSGGAAGNSGAGAAEFAAGDLRFVGAGGGKLAALVARDLDYLVRQSPEAIAAATRRLGPMAGVLVNGPLRNLIAPENQRTRVKTLEWRDISFAGLMQYGLKGEKPPITARSLINLGTARFTDAETFIGDKRLSIAPQTDISAMEFAWLAPSKIRAVSRGGVYDFTAYVPDDEKQAIGLLKARGLDKVKGDNDFAYDWNPDKGGAVASAGFDSEGFADFDFDLALEGLELKKIEAARAEGAPRPAADMAQRKLFSIVIADEQMLDAFYELSALETGGTAKDVRAATPSMMRLGKIELQRESPRLASYIDAVADFLEEGGTLEIKAAPETPLPMNALAATAQGGPDAMAAAVNLTVTRKK
ncbi:MAG: hypothetical protein AAB227_07450 [Pseudomonadota bacterium]